MTIDLARARELLRLVVEARGRDFVYNPYRFGATCLYRPLWIYEASDADDPRLTTGCAVGEALALAGETRHRNFEGSVDALHCDYPDMMTREAAKYFGVAQSEQDGGSTWGEALHAAEGWAGPEAVES